MLSQKGHPINAIPLLLSFYSFVHINQEGICNSHFRNSSPFYRFCTFTKTNESKFQALQIQILILQLEDGVCLLEIIPVRTRTQGLLKAE